MGECVLTGSSWLVDTMDGFPRKVSGSGLAFADDGRLVTGAGVFEPSSDNPTVALESTLPVSVDFPRKVLKTVVSDLYQTGYFLVEEEPGRNYIVEVDLQTGVVGRISARALGAEPRALGISNDELFTLMSDGSVISETVRGRTHPSLSSGACRGRAAGRSPRVSGGTHFRRRRTDGRGRRCRWIRENVGDGL